MAWDYAEKVHEMKMAGGPEAYTDMIERGGEQKGIVEGAVGTILVAGTAFVVLKIKDLYKNYVTKKELAEAKEHLIEEIRGNEEPTEEKEEPEDDDH